MGTSSPVPGAALRFPAFCSLGRVKFRDEQMGAWEVEEGGDGGGRVGMGRAQRMPSSCERTWHASQSGILFHLGRGCQGEVVRKWLLPLGQDCMIIVQSKSPEIKLKATEWTVALLAKSRTRVVFLLLILIFPNFREFFFFLLNSFMNIAFQMCFSPWTELCFCFLGWPRNCSQVLACVFTAMHRHQKKPCKPNTRLGKGWRKMGEWVQGKEIILGYKGHMWRWLGRAYTNPSDFTVGASICLSAPWVNLLAPARLLLTLWGMEKWISS